MTKFSEFCPDLARRLVVVGGVAVAYAEAEAAVEILRESRTSAIAPVLNAAGSPLAMCQYKLAASPYIEKARQAPKTGKSGAAGRHVTKDAFLEAIRHKLEDAERAQVLEAFEAFGSDERYATAMAQDAMVLLSSSSSIVPVVLEIEEGPEEITPRELLEAAIHRGIAHRSSQEILVAVDSYVSVLRLGGD